VARLARTDDVWLWRPLGLVIGVGLLNKVSLLFFAFGLAVAVLVTPLRRHLARRELWEGVVLALVLLSPYVLWQLRHDWATLEFMRNASRYKNVALSPLSFATAQILDLHPLNAPIWLMGLGWLLFGPRGRRFRALGIVLLAAGALVVEGFTERQSWRWVRPALLAVLALGGAMTAPLAVPVLPVEALIAYQRALGITPTAAERNRLGPLNQHFADRFGWEELTREVARIYATLPAEERGKVRIVTRNYGEAGAIDYYGRPYGLPTAVSPHNNYYLWGPGPDDAQVLIMVGWSSKELAGSFSQVEVAGRVESPYAMPFETRWPIHLCRGLKAPLPEAWRQGKMFI
jgi:hypothetical protein